MSDIVEKLRASAELFDILSNRQDLVKLQTEAADEIEELRLKLAWVRVSTNNDPAYRKS